eukprot:gene9918-13366_t
MARSDRYRQRCVLTEGGAHFITPMTLAALSENPVFTSLWDLKDEAEMGHIQLSREADLVVVAPATADLMAKMAAGIADDLATTRLSVAMNVRMWQHAATRRNVATLRGNGVTVMEPDEGDDDREQHRRVRLAEEGGGAPEHGPKRVGANATEIDLAVGRMGLVAPLADEAHERAEAGADDEGNERKRHDELKVARRDEVASGSSSRPDGRQVANSHPSMSDTPPPDISHDQHAVRRAKLAEMRAGGFDPFRANVATTHFSADAKALYVEGQDNVVSVTVAGRLVTFRVQGGSSFVKIQD